MGSIAEKGRRAGQAPVRVIGSSDSAVPGSSPRGSSTAWSASSPPRSHWAPGTRARTGMEPCARSPSSPSARPSSRCSPWVRGVCALAPGPGDPRQRQRGRGREGSCEAARIPRAGGLVRGPLRANDREDRGRRRLGRQRAADCRRRARNAFGALDCARSRSRVPGRGGVQRLPRGHVQVREEAEEERDERGREGGATGVGILGYLARGVLFSLVGIFLVRPRGSTTPSRPAVSTARCSSSRSSRTAGCCSGRSRSG